MPLEITNCQREEMTRVICPDCGEWVRGIWLLKSSRIEGLIFRCSRCGAHKKVRAEPEEKVNKP